VERTHLAFLRVDIAVVVNLRARRGSHEVVRACRELLPGARVLASGSLDDAIDFARGLSERPPSLVVAAGGDGTVVTLINAMRDNVPARCVTDVMTTPPGVPPTLHAPALGLVPLGTGNGWARAMGAPRWRKAVARLGHLAESDGPLPLKRFDLIEVCGTVAHFAGTGWDAEMIDDFHAQQTGGLLPERARMGLAGYVYGVFTRTIPRHLTEPQVEVELTNTGADAWTVDDDGRPIPLRGGEHGAVLYRGPASVCSAGTTPEWGFGFRAFPFAGLVPRRFCMRIYAGRALEATSRLRSLWTGAHPVPKMHTWLVDRCKATFSRPVPFQVGGDRLGKKTEVEYALSTEQVDVLDWRRMGSA
jgi:diacylglycerol kinase family enzyme